LKHPNTTVATSKRKQMKHLKQVSEIFTKIPRKYMKTNKHMQYPDETLAKHMYKTLENT
jgi:uncharacterized membrane-anchored protein YhcB (DUF1043 family)